MNRFKGVLFDLDDTLYPEKQFHQSAHRALAAYTQKVFGIDILPELQNRYDAGERGDLCEAVFKAKFRQVDPLLSQRLREIANSHKPDISLYPDARVGLAMLNAQRMPCGLVTDYHGHTQRNKVRALNLEMLMDSFLYADDLGGPEFWRPNPEPLHVMAIQMDCELSEFIFVGDNPQLDFIAPRQLGMGTIQIVRPDGEHAHSIAPNPNQAAHVRIPSLEMLWEAVQMLDRSLSSAVPEQRTAPETVG